jgi:hypothetical protein
MNELFPESHKLWIEQCRAAEDIRAAFGFQNALEYLIGEKLLGWVGRADSDPEFAPELPKFLIRLRRIFTDDEIAAYLDRLQRSKYRRLRDPRLTKDEQDISIDDMLEFRETTSFFRMRQLLGHPDPKQ